MEPAEHLILHNSFIDGFKSLMGIDRLPVMNGFNLGEIIHLIKVIRLRLLVLTHGRPYGPEIWEDLVLITPLGCQIKDEGLEDSWPCDKAQVPGVHGRQRCPRSR